jgi:hypothetical protein
MGYRNKILGSVDACKSCLPGALCASFWQYLTLKASHVCKNEWLSGGIKKKFFFRILGESTLEKMIPPKMGLDAAWVS